MICARRGAEARGKRMGFAQGREGRQEVVSWPKAILSMRALPCQSGFAAQRNTFALIASSREPNLPLSSPRLRASA